MRSAAEDNCAPAPVQLCCFQYRCSMRKREHSPGPVSASMRARTRADGKPTPTLLTWRSGENTRAPLCNPTSSQLSRKMNSKSTIRLLSSASASRADRQRIKKRKELKQTKIQSRAFTRPLAQRKNLLGRDRPLATRGRSSAAAAPARARKQENMQNCTMCEIEEAAYF